MHRCRKRRTRSNSFVTALRTGKRSNWTCKLKSRCKKGISRVLLEQSTWRCKKIRLWLTYFMRARLLARQRRYELAIQDCNWVLGKYPKFIEAALLRAQANADLGKYAESLKELDYLVRIRPHLDSYARALSSRGWLLATCPNPSFRNGGQAVQDAKIACKLTNWTDESTIDSLAAAYAETGDFDSAVRYAEQALTVNGISSVASRIIQRHLASFKEHKPIRS
jgi:tetratricopeptide (TPR) repeat protein